MNSFEKEILASHNKHRTHHQAPPLIWNARLSNEAQEWAERLAKENRLKHADTEDGENIYMAFGKDVNGEEATNKWYEEIKNYSFGRPGFQSNTGHFTQVVWKGSRELGAGKAVGRDGKVFVVARYRPPGNNLRAFDENVAPCKKGSTWDTSEWDSMKYDERESTPKPDQYKRYSGRWEYSTEPMRNRQPFNKRYSDGWQSLSINDDRSWIQHEPIQSTNQEPVKKTSTKPAKVKDDQSWIQNKGANTRSSWSEPRTRLSNGYDHVTTSSVRLQENKPPNKMFSQPDTRKQGSDPWNSVARKQDRPARVTNFDEPNKRMSDDWDAVDCNTRQGKPKHEDTKRSAGQWDPISDYNQTFPMAKWDSGKWFEPLDDSTDSVPLQSSAPSKNFEAWDDDYRREPTTKDKRNKRHSGRWQPGVNDVMFKEPRQERVYSTNEPLKTQDSTGKTKNIADRWEKSNKVRESNDRSLRRNGSTEVDGMRYHGIQSGSGKTRESIRRWEQNASGQPEPISIGNRSNQSSQSVPYRSNSISQSSRSNRPSQSNPSYPTNQSNRYSWPGQSNQSAERWDPLWQDDRSYNPKQRPASIEGSKIREEMIQNTQTADYESSPYREPHERKIITTIVDGPKKTVVSSLTITLKGNEGRVGVRSKSSEDLRPKSSYLRGSRTPKREAYSSYPYAEASRIDSRSKSSEDLRSRDTTHSRPMSSRAPVNEDLFVAEEFKPRQNQPDYHADLFVAEEIKPRQIHPEYHDTTDGYRSIKPVTKFPSLGHFAQQALETHNHYRSFHGVQNLMWSAELADSAQAWAEKLARDRTLKHTPRERNADGQNVAMLPRGSKNPAKQAIDSWYNEIQNYNFNKPGYTPKAGHFTQVVWKDTKEFGMGSATSSDGSLVVVVARYRPTGNVLRRYELNVFPKIDIIDF